jgi:hypothetical protein
MGMFILANVIGSSVQISMLPLPVLSTLQASGLVFNSICATLILGEPFTRWSLWGTLLVCSGAVLIAIFGAIPSPAHKLSELLELLGRRPFVMWMIFQAVLVVAVAVATDLTSHLKQASQSARFRLFRGLAYGCISGILSAHSLLVAKSAVELVLRTIADRDNQFVHWQSWMLVLALLTLALSQLYYLHRGLKLVSTSVLYPLVFCIYNIIAILDGLIYFDQTELITPLHACLITLGTIILLSGVLALSWRLNDEQHPPGVGQSSLTPGLGLMEDTEGEEDEEELLLNSDLGDNDEDCEPTTYNTFAPPTAKPANGARQEELTLPPGPLRRWSAAPSAQTSASLWLNETAEIWDELEDRNDLEFSPLLTPAQRRRSSTLPGGPATAPLLTSHRRVTGPIPGAEGSGDTAAATNTRRGDLHRRRRSTGFPGFTARKTMKRTTSVSGAQDALGGLMRFQWWRNMKRHGKAVADPEQGRLHGLGLERDVAVYSDDPPRPSLERSGSGAASYGHTGGRSKSAGVRKVDDAPGY